MDVFIKQIKEKGFKPLLYSIFGYMDDNGYIDEWNSMFKTKLTPDDFEYVLFTLKENEINGLKYRSKDVITTFNKLKTFFDVEVQCDEKLPKAKLFVLKDEGKVFLVKFKTFDLTSKLNSLNN